MASGTQTQSIADLTTETKPTSGDIPPPLVGASTTVVGNKVYVFGGRLVSSRQMTNDLYTLDMDTLVWTLHAAPESDSPPPPRPRYFHSCNLFGRSLVVFGGMSYSIRRSSQNLCALDDVCLLDLDSMTWKYPDVQPSIYTPQARYAHLAVCAADKLVIMGGQDMSNLYINETSVFDLTTAEWIHGGSLVRQYGAYRAVAFCPSSVDTSAMATQPFWETHDTKDDYPLCVYSNYNFADVTRDLQSFAPFTSTPKFRDHSKDMSGACLPPGLRFPSGDLLGHHLILTGTYLTPSHRSFHIWALNLTNLVWVRIETGSILAQGSWNKGVLHQEKQQFLVFGDRTRDLLEDYNHRQVNFGHVAVVELEAFGIYSHPKETCAPVAQELGLSMLNEPSMSDMEFLTNDGRTIPANSSVIALRWKYFASMLGRRKQARKAYFKRLSFPESYAVTLAFLQYIYTDHLMTTQQHQPQILSRLLFLADAYALPRLAELATHALHQVLNINTASIVYEASALTGRTCLQVRALRVMINAKKMLHQHQLQQLQQQQQLRQQQQQQLYQHQPMEFSGEYHGSITMESPFAYPSHYTTSPPGSARQSHDEEQGGEGGRPYFPSSSLSPSSSSATMKRLTSSRSTTAAASPDSLTHPTSPKLSNTSNIIQKTAPLFAERQRKESSTALLPSMMSTGNPQQQQNVKLTPSFESRPNMGIRF
ncbi:hypothetical protein [Parasitella parasitica]|uniref:BTB domain-containing protein n=1 Tax=Parasitella parasitica TaxID=35722 RepID=A0A0B7NJW3_9FUNG|nr:hypothetical protein [Parasitella parasitica]